MLCSFSFSFPLLIAALFACLPMCTCAHVRLLWDGGSPVYCLIVNNLPYDVDLLVLSNTLKYLWFWYWVLRCWICLLFWSIFWYLSMIFLIYRVGIGHATTLCISCWDCWNHVPKIPFLLLLLYFLVIWEGKLWTLGCFNLEGSVSFIGKGYPPNILLKCCGTGKESLLYHHGVFATGAHHTIF